MIKKVFLAALALVGSVSLANAQEIFHKGSTAVNAGVGIGSIYSNLTIPPLSVSLDYGVVDNLINDNNGSISVGGYVGYTASSANYGVSKYRTSYAILGARGAFHYQFAPKLDTYAGLMLSYNLASSSWSGEAVPAVKAANSDLGITAYLGARYFFTESVGAFAELGYGISNLNLGVTFKL